MSTKRTGQQLLLDAIWVARGGRGEVSRTLKFHRQNVHNWMNRGAVPLERVGWVSRWLGESIYAFNYEGVIGLLGEGPSWEDVVRDCGLSPAITKKVLAAKAPRKVEEICEQ